MGTGFRFEAVSARDYEGLRPGYAPDAVAWVAGCGDLGEGSLVVDLAAGTGQLTRVFALHGVEVVAVEPAANMRAVLLERFPGRDIREGTAEAIPLRDGEADAIVVGNAFHHFDAGIALAEIRRVLRPGGTLALFWARPDVERTHETYPGLRAIEETVDAATRTERASSTIARAYRAWFATPPSAVEGFSPFERRDFPLVHAVPSSRLADLYATSSDVASLSTPTRTELLDAVRELSAHLPATLNLPMRTVVDRCRSERWSKREPATSRRRRPGPSRRPSGRT
jgi:SAM-dependent methyltransferase